MADNLPLAVAIANFGRMYETTESVGATAQGLTQSHPDSDFSLSDIAAALHDQRRGTLPHLQPDDPWIWFV
jgi:hypothetical protein